MPGVPRLLKPAPSRDHVWRRPVKTRDVATFLCVDLRPVFASCTSFSSYDTGYGGVLFELSAEAGDIRALFIDVAANYGYLETLDDYGPTLISAGTTTYIGTVTLGMYNKQQRAVGRFLLKL